MEESARSMRDVLPTHVAPHGRRRVEGQRASPLVELMFSRLKDISF